MIEKKLLLKILRRIVDGIESNEYGDDFFIAGYLRCIEDIEHFLDEEDAIYDEEDAKDIL